MRAAPDELDRLIEELTVDCYNEDEQLTGFLTAIGEEPMASIAATVVGAPVEVLAFDYDGDLRHGLTARCRREGTAYIVSALDLEVLGESNLSRILAAYARWSEGGLGNSRA